MSYPLVFRQTGIFDLYSPANVKLAGPLPIQVFKPLLATSLNTYTSGGSTIWSPGAMIIRAVVPLAGQTAYDVPGAAGRYMVFPDLPGGPKKWRIVSAFTWPVSPDGKYYTNVFLGEFV